MTFSPAKLSIGSSFVNLLLSPRTAVRHWFRDQRLPADNFVDLEQMASWAGVPMFATSGEKVLLLASFLPLPYSIKIEGLIARAMQARGYRILILTNQSSRNIVEAYHAGIHGFEVILIENYLHLWLEAPLDERLDRLWECPTEIMERVKAYRYRDAYVGQHSLATLSASIVDGKVDLAGTHRSFLKRILKRSMLHVDAAFRILDQHKPSLILGVEKGFVGTAEILYAAMSRQIDYVQWVACHEPNSIMMKRYRWHNFRDHPFSLAADSWEKVLTLPWSATHADAVMEQFENGYKEGVWFKHKYLDLTGDQQQRDREELVRQLNLDPAKKTAIIYSHILNDANLFYGTDLFAGGFEEWLIETVRAAASNSAVNWILKVHPANVFRNVKLGYKGKYGEIVALERAFGQLPNFLRVVYPEEKTSPLSFFKVSDYGITVRGTVGLELPSFGIPTLTAGTGRYSGKGFTIDSVTREEYLDRIRYIQNIPPLTRIQVELGQRYAYYIFRARPARYGKMFEDVYNFPVKHPRHRDVAIGKISLVDLISHPQMTRITNFLSSSAEDFLDFDLTHPGQQAATRQS